MKLFEIILTAISLAADAFSISICKGINSCINYHKGFIIALSFGLFQFFMPIMGYYLGNIFSEKLLNINPYISTFLLIIIGILMLKEKNDDINNSLKISELLLLSFATSIDAFVIGISFAFLNVSLISSSIIIGLITFILCFLGYLLGHSFNHKIGKYANLIGGITLIIIGLKILFQTI